MKRFLITMVALLLSIVAGYYLYYVEGYYINFDNHATVSTPFYIENDTIYHKNGEDVTPFIIKGVEVDGAYGPKRGTDFTVDEQTWLRWFNMIQEMGANTIRVSTILDDQFYNAFYQYNKDRENPLYLLQGMRAATDEWKTNKVKENLPFYQTLRKDGRELVDIIHGRKVMLVNDHQGTGIYRHDISQWVIGFLIGDHWNQDMVAYINQTLNTEEDFIGDYVTTSQEATAFEVMMAKTIEYIVSYESEKYDSQHLVSVNSSFIMDPFQYKEEYALQFGKYNTFLIDHINPTKKMKSGLFASYAYEDQTDPILTMIEDEEIAQYPNASSYLDLIQQTHDVPVVISSFGYPSASYLNHTGQQESEIIDDLKSFNTNGFNGAIIRSWQDVWDRRVIETSYAVDLQQVSKWHDPLTWTQHFGLLGFKPYRDDVLMKVDGKSDDWQDVPVNYQDGATKVTMTRDHAYLYFWIEDPSITVEKPFYLGLDLHPELGSQTPDTVATTFDREVEFLIEVSPEEGALVYVQDRYQSVRQNFLELVTGENPYVSYPEQSSNTFEVVKYLQKEKKVLTKEEIEQETKVYHYTFAEMNPLRMLNGKNVKEADVAIEDGRLEIRLPYQLLHVYDPLKFTIHDDYYQHYGVVPLKIDAFYVSLVRDENRPSQSVEIPIQQLESLNRVKEYVKPSYEKVKAYWRGED
ncbi:hypothetical protein [Ornithinibacillus californiensis]|uniref:hypothetical protein n=1 Tax=Ornithinibacillus californiensis TaxID=161536 RepID=UPI00064E0746|nr:hypothetical protein [Ornithinibacillus californiensis]